MFQELSAIEYIKCEIACKHDKAFEKSTWNDRLKHFKYLQDSEQDESIYLNASDPIGLKSAIIAYKNAIKSEPSGYMISLDACSSGLQLLSLLSGCEKSFDLCGGISDQCVDSYTALYAAMGLGDVLTRKQAKNAIMTSLYGSTSTPEATFKDNIDTFYDTMETMAPGAWELNLALQELWDEVEGNSYSWVMPDNFHCHIETHVKEWKSFKFIDQEYKLAVKVPEKPEFHKGIGPNIIHSVDGMMVREMLRRCMFDKSKLTDIIHNLDSTNKDGPDREMVQKLWWNYLSSGFLSVRILNYLTADTMGLVDPLVIAKLIQELPDNPFDVIAIHDCFKCHANYGNDLRRQYNFIMNRISKSHMLQFIGQQVTSNPNLKVEKFGNIPEGKLLNSNYMLA